MYKVWLAAVVAVLLVLPAGLSNAQDRRVVSFASGQWPPYLSEHLPQYGFASHMIREAFAAVGIDVEYRFFPWQRSYDIALAGRYDNGDICHGTPVWVYTDERAESFLFSDVVIEDTEILFSLKSNPVDWKLIDDLRGKVIGVTQHAVYPPLDAAEKRGLLKMERRGGYDHLYKRLLHGRIDAVPQVRQVGCYYIRNMLSVQQADKITFSPNPIQFRRYHLIFSKNVAENVELVAAFNRGLALIKENGLFRKQLNFMNQGGYDSP